MFFTAFRILRNYEDAKDIVSDFLKYILEKSHRIDYISNPTAWISQSIRNNAIKYSQKRLKTVSIMEVSQELCAAVPDYDFIIRLDEILNTFTELENTLFEMRFLIGYSSKEIAKETGRPVGTIDSDIFRIKAKLKPLKDYF